MNDKGWMLNPDAIKQARMCINIIQEELGVKLKLSHPEFLNMINDYVDLTESVELEMAYRNLLQFDGEGKGKKTKKTIVPIKQDMPLAKASVTSAPRESEETINYKGKTYPKYCEGKTFKGLYRGQARYN
jgi:hypothetical protein